MTALLVIAWLAIGAIDAGFAYAYFQRHYSVIADSERRADTWFAVFMFLGGPCGLISSVLAGAILKGNPLQWFSCGWLFPGSKP